MLDHQKSLEFIEVLCQKIGGDWLLAGGSLVYLFLGGQRATHDIDVLNISHQNLSETSLRKTFFQEAKAIGLSPDQVNSSFDFFLHKCEGWENHLILLKKGKLGNLYRPTLTLFLALKLNRGTDIDIEDCKMAAKKCKDDGFDLKLFEKWAESKAQKIFAQHRKNFDF